MLAGYSLNQAMKEGISSLNSLAALTGDFSCCLDSDLTVDLSIVGGGVSMFEGEIFYSLCEILGFFLKADSLDYFLSWRQANEPISLILVSAYIITSFKWLDMASSLYITL